MRAINVISIEKNKVIDLETFLIYEEQLSGDVLEIAEKYFKKKISEYDVSVDEDLLDSYIDNRIYENKNISISLMWTTVND